ncbi:MAG: sigma-54 interaction domain-containing protein, partial [Planctomycetota bacterium]
IGPLVARHEVDDLNPGADATLSRGSQRRSRAQRETAKLATADEQAGGVLILVAQHRHSFSAAQLTMLQQLLEPMAAALENDRRLHELATLREAAEADRRTLLTRLGREQLQEAVVGAETGLRRVMERVTLVAASDAPVLILGETGTGKEVVSRAIHARSPRAAAPFIRVNCGAIPPELIDSQLFGHERGSFTGAEDSRKGWFERADGGTLFLDEIGELPLPAQVRLLRVLQDGFIERVGGQSPVRVDVRIVAATHRDLAAMVKAGSFREDLWYRINVFPILLPRLSERREDIPSLVRHFAHRAALRFGLAEAQPTAADLSLLMNYHWPGNIRELGAVIDRATILGEGRRLEVAAAMGLGAPAGDAAGMQAVASERSEHADQAGQLERLNRPGARESSGEALAHARVEESATARVTLPTLAEATKRHIEQALAISRGRVEGRGGAADLLRINPHTLRARMRKLKVDWTRFRAQ